MSTKRAGKRLPFYDTASACFFFGMLAARGEEISAESSKNAMIAIRSLFPQKSMITFATPSIGTVEKLLTKFGDCSNKDFNNKVDRILNSV